MRCRLNLRRQLPQGAIGAIKFVNSRNDLLVQLVDMYAGALIRYHADNDALWMKAIKPRVEHIRLV
jgi:hypothetical protein